MLCGEPKRAAIWPLSRSCVFEPQMWFCVDVPYVNWLESLYRMECLFVGYAEPGKPSNDEYAPNSAAVSRAARSNGAALQFSLSTDVFGAATSRPAGSITGNVRLPCRLHFVAPMNVQSLLRMISASVEGPFRRFQTFLCPTSTLLRNQHLRANLVSVPAHRPLLREEPRTVSL